MFNQTCRSYKNVFSVNIALKTSDTQDSENI